MHTTNTFVERRHSVSLPHVLHPSLSISVINCIDEEGVELILKESIRVNVAIEDKKKEENDKKDKKDGRGRKSDKEQTDFIDSTVQEKNVTFPTDSKLLNKIISYCHRVTKSEDGNNFPDIHIHIMNINGWLRGIHHHCIKEQLQGYLDEYHFRYNRRNNMDTIFDLLIQKTVQQKTIRLESK